MVADVVSISVPGTATPSHTWLLSARTAARLTGEMTFSLTSLKLKMVTLDSVIGKLESLFGITRVCESVFHFEFYEI